MALISCPAPLFSGIQNSGPEEPDHETDQTWATLTRTLDISGILGLHGPWEVILKKKCKKFIFQIFLFF